MESIHLHPDSHRDHKKKWTEYLLEFFMLFLAVFLGFLAENWREHIAETSREKEYVGSFIEDLKLDTASINANIVLRRNKINTLDSLILYLNVADPNQYSR